MNYVAGVFWEQIVGIIIFDKSWNKFLTNNFLQPCVCKANTGQPVRTYFQVTNNYGFERNLVVNRVSDEICNDSLRN